MLTAFEEAGIRPLQKGSIGKHLNHLEPILHNPDVRAAVQNYFGGQENSVTGYSMLRLSPSVSVNEYPSGQWHHDRCGRRLKLFVYTDVRNAHASLQDPSPIQPLVVLFIL